jgi:hypothetical protein
MPKIVDTSSAMPKGSVRTSDPYIYTFTCSLEVT